MKIVIDIDDNLYTRLFGNGVDNYDDAVDIAKAIRNGTPLKGHGRLIDENQLLEEIRNDIVGNFDNLEYWLSAADTIIEADKVESEE